MALLIKKLVKDNRKKYEDRSGHSLIVKLHKMEMPDKSEMA